MISEIILEDKGEIKVARVLLKYNLPVSKYPEFGTWCYLINAKKKIQKSNFNCLKKNMS